MAERDQQAIWTVPVTLEALIEMVGLNMTAHLGIEFTEIGDDFLRGTMPVDDRTRQPFGFLHGGASAVLAETLGSVAASLTVDVERQRCVGVEINASHLRAVRDGLVIGTARPIRLGRKLQVWEISIEDEQGRLVCISRLTLAVVAL